MLRNLLTIEIISKNKKYLVPTRHQMYVNIHNDIVRNKNRLSAHCKSLAKKTYGNDVCVERVLNSEGVILWEAKNAN